MPSCHKKFSWTQTASYTGKYILLIKLNVTIIIFAHLTELQGSYTLTFRFLKDLSLYFIIITNPCLASIQKTDMLTGRILNSESIKFMLYGSPESFFQAIFQKDTFYDFLFVCMSNETF